MEINWQINKTCNQIYSENVHTSVKFKFDCPLIDRLIFYAVQKRISLQMNLVFHPGFFYPRSILIFSRTIFRLSRAENLNVSAVVAYHRRWTFITKLVSETVTRTDETTSVYCISKKFNGNNSRALWKRYTLRTGHYIRRYYAQKIFYETLWGTFVELTNCCRQREWRNGASKID